MLLVLCVIFLFCALYPGYWYTRPVDTRPGPYQLWSPLALIIVVFIVLLLVGAVRIP